MTRIVLSRKMIVRYLDRMRLTSDLNDEQLAKQTRSLLEHKARLKRILLIYKRENPNRAGRIEQAGIRRHSRAFLAARIFTKSSQILYKPSQPP
ncbi:MAG: hypothetical protein RBS68_11310 [Anaerolineales bacterium]|jgi:hypothetical protein|nr:hypothetical protein [Anaerolineales bacterium]